MLGIEHPREGSRKMSSGGRGVGHPPWVSRRGDTSLLPKSFKTLYECDRGIWGGFEAERQHNFIKKYDKAYF